LLRATLKQSQPPDFDARSPISIGCSPPPASGQALLTAATVPHRRGNYADAQRDCRRLALA